MIFVHLLNDRSGSPTVLASVIEAIAQDSDVLIVSEGDGALADLKVAKWHYPYSRFSNKWFTLTSYLVSQLALMVFLFWRTRKRSRREAIYINTALPFGAAVFGRLSGRPVIYHLHEVSISPRLLQKFLWKVVSMTASEVRFVSDFQRRTVEISHENTRVIHNAISARLASEAAEYQRGVGSEVFNVVMLATLRDYKGVPEFIELARRYEKNRSFHFQLIANDDAATVKQYFETKRPLPSNFTVEPRTDQLSPIYVNASLVVNMSRPQEWVETFGLTLLEAMSFGVPVIAPPVGGPVELLGDDLSAYLIEGTDLESICEKISALSENSDVYAEVSEKCLKRATHFSRERFIANLAMAEPTA